MRYSAIQVLLRQIQGGVERETDLAVGQSFSFVMIWFMKFGVPV